MGRAYLYLGSARGLATTPVTTLTGPDGAGGHFGPSVASAGDVNGDGFADVIVGADYVNSNAGRAYVYLGSAAGLTATPATTLTGPDGAGGYFGGFVASAGDVNGDGYADVVVGAFAANSFTGRAYVYLGSATGLATAPATTLTAPDGGSFGYGVASAGDVNADGFADVIVGAYTANSWHGPRIRLPRKRDGYSHHPLDDAHGPDAGGQFGSVCGGDVNGDGFADVIVGENYANSETGRAYVYLGGSIGSSTTPATTLTGPDGPTGGSGTRSRIRAM